jgi:hypothetical protein
MTSTAALSPPPPSPPTTTEPSLRDQLIAAHKAYEVAYTRCAADPGTCDVSSVVVAGSPAAAGVASFMAELAHDGLRGRQSPQTYYVYEGFTVANTGTQAVLLVCTVDANVIVKPGSGPGGQDVIVNDRVDSDLGDWTFRINGSTWRLYVTAVISQWKDSNRCPPRPVG